MKRNCHCPLSTPSSRTVPAVRVYIIPPCASGKTPCHAARCAGLQLQDKHLVGSVGVEPGTRQEELSLRADSLVAAEVVPVDKHHSLDAARQV